MAKRIKIGNPVNDAEVWGFEHLEKVLPDDYWLITNVELPTATGQLLEIDAIFFGHKAIYLIDIKGYSGKLMVDANTWMLDDQKIDNPLSKANQAARVFASRIRETLGRDEHAPWCQGAVFVTGHRGESLSLQKSQNTLSVFGPADILNGFTNDAYVTSPYKHRVTESQRQRALDVLGRVGVKPEGPLEVFGFNKIRKLDSEKGIDTWWATSLRGELKTDWLLKEVDMTSGSEDVRLASKQLKSEYIRYQQLYGVTGVASCAPLMMDGERMVLSIRKPSGVSLAELTEHGLSRDSALIALRTLVSAVEQFDMRGLGYVAPGEDQVFLETNGDLTLLPSPEFAENDVSAFKALQILWSKLSSLINSKSIARWFDSEASLESLKDLRFLIAAEISGNTRSAEPQPGTIIEAGGLLLGRYRLESRLQDVAGVQTWKAFHEAGKFPIVCTVVDQASQRWSEAQRRLAMLMQNFHPAVERIFDIEHIPAEDLYLVSRAWIDGELLEALEDESRVVPLLIKSLEALEYIHGMGILHRRICPEHLLFQGHSPFIIGLSVLPGDELSDSMPDYVHASVAHDGWSERADLWALIKSFVDVLGDDLASVDSSAFSRLSAFVKEPDQVELVGGYVEMFELVSPKSITELDASLCETWGISKGYMRFIVLDMLNDQHPRSRNQIVLNALRSRSIAGNKTNKGSMRATVSRLKAAEIAEDYGKKIRLTEKFLEDWNRSVSG